MSSPLHKKTVFMNGKCLRFRSLWSLSDFWRQSKVHVWPYLVCVLHTQELFDHNNNDVNPDNNGSLFLRLRGLWEGRGFFRLLSRQGNDIAPWDGRFHCHCTSLWLSMQLKEVLSESHFQTLTKLVGTGHRKGFVESPHRVQGWGLLSLPEGLRVTAGYCLQVFLVRARKKPCTLGGLLGYAQHFLTTSSGLTSTGKWNGKF